MRRPTDPPPKAVPARIGQVVLIAVVTTALSWALLDLLAGSGQDPLPLPWTAVAGTAALAAAVLSLGVPVRRWVSGSRDRPLDPLYAARAFVLAKAAAYGGAVLTGWYAAQALALLPDIVGVRREKLVLALLAAVAAVGISVAGLVVQRWCRVPPSGDNDDDGDGDEDPR